MGTRLAAYYHESWDERLGGWGGWLTLEHHAEDGAKRGHVRFSEPSKCDKNHDDGNESLHLVKFLFSDPLGDMSAQQGGSAPDLFDAKV